jgi:hypothetical protein
LSGGFRLLPALAGCQSIEHVGKARGLLLGLLAGGFGGL